MSAGDLSRSAAGARLGALEALQQEMLGEMASTLGRATAAFETALAAYQAEGIDAVAERRERLLAAAGEALWHFVVQREACGLRNTEAVLRDYRVPAELRLRMGISRR